MAEAVIPAQRLPMVACCTAAGEGVAPGVLEQVRELVQSGCRASQDLERKGGIQARRPTASTLPPACLTCDARTCGRPHVLLSSVCTQPHVQVRCLVHRPA